MTLKMFDDLHLVEGLYSKSQVVDVSRLGARRRTTYLPESSIDADQVDH